MAYRAAQLNFTKGEISPDLESRFDISIYNAGLRKASNVRILRTGGVTKRMGTRFVVEAAKTASPRLIAFQFSDEQAYALEHGQAYMRPLALGGAVLETQLKVLGITKAAQAQVTVQHHGYKTGETIYFSGITGMTEINDRFLKVTSVVDANNFRVNFNSTNAGTFTGSGGGTTRDTTPTPTPSPTPQPPPVVEPPPPPPTSGGGGGYKPPPEENPTLPPTWEGGDGREPRTVDPFG
jgi:hypothetical protein